MKLKKVEEAMNAFAQMYSTLSKWEVRSASLDNPSVVIVFLGFLKYISVYKNELKLDYPEKYSIDFMSLLYGQKVMSDELIEHITSVEQQLGFDRGILSSFIADLQLLNLEKELRELLDIINKIEIEDGEEGVIYEALTEYLAIQARNDMRFASEYTTDNRLAKLMGRIADVRDEMSVYDFTAGYGTLLSEATRGKNVNIYAQDIYRVATAVSIMLLVMSGQKNAVVGCDNTLTHPLIFDSNITKFDRVLSTPPLGLRVDNEMSRIKSGQQAEAFEYGLAYKLSGDIVFVRHLLATLNEDGIGIMLVPMSTLFKGGNEGKIREEMVRDNYIDSVIEMPSGILPNTNVKTALVVFKKNRNEDDIYFVDLAKDSKEYTEKIGRVGVRFTEYGIDKVMKLIAEKKELPQVSVRIKCKTLMGQGVNLCPGSYLQVKLNELDDIQDIDKLIQENSNLFKKLEAVTTKLNGVIERLG